MSDHMRDTTDGTTQASREAEEQDVRKNAGGLIGVAINQPVFTTMIMVGLMVLGLFSFRRLAVDQFPDVSIPIVSIQTTWTGASTESVERDLTKRIEEAVNPTSGVDKITSTSLEGVSSIVVQFKLGTNIDAATADVRSKIEQIRRELPTDIDPPVVQQFDPADQPIVSLALASDSLSIGALTTLADGDIRRALEGVDGVGRVQITGGLAREVQVLLDPAAMQARGVTVSEVMTALRQQNLDIPAGRVEEANREAIVRVVGKIRDPEQFSRVIVAQRPGGAVRLGDLATVSDSTEEARSMALVDGRRAVGIDLLKVAGGNTVAVADGVQRALKRLESTLPASAKLSVVRDNSVTIRQSVDSVEHELILGAILTVAIVFLFLNDGRATTITALSLPVSVVSTFILFAVLGFTLNIMTLMALSLSIGILIDDAIVVIENIVRRRELGEGPYVAAFRGTKEIFLAVMATTLTLVAVFVPVAFMGGIIGKFFFEFGMAIAWAVLVSLLVSFTLVPMLAAHWSGGAGHTAHVHNSGLTSRNPVTRLIARLNLALDRIARAYRKIITWALGHRLTTLGIAGASFVGALALFPLIGGAFQPAQDSSAFMVTFKTPVGSSLAYGESKAREVAEVLRGLTGVDYTYATVGAGVTGSVTRGDVYVKLVPRDQRAYTQMQLMAEARTALTRIYGVEASVLEDGGLGGAVKPLQIAVRGPDVVRLQELSAQVMKEVQQVPGAIEVESSLGDPKPELRLQVDIDKASDLGLNASVLASTISPLLAGQTATTWEDPTGESHDVVVRLPAAARTTADRIASLPIATTRTREGVAGTITVPLGDVAALQEGVGPAQIDREALARVATIAANLAPDANLSDVSSAIQQRVSGMTLPAGYTVSLGGDTEQLQETAGYVVESLVLAIVLIYLVLASQFGSFVQPLAIMASVPLALIGVLLGLLITGDTLNIMSMIGVILLVGLVVKNAILLIDNANQRRREGMDMRTALIEAGEVRLRPILMTTLAMIAGMIPVALGTGEGGEFRAPMGRAVIGGLITSTVLTLLVVPVVYTYFEQMGAWVSRKITGAQVANPMGSATLTPEVGD
ncbi:MAG: efflux RND transporter permease subunit [Gemmatimonadaceae bacterium]|nr:efflux RND transporter permease subunit [Gemmatimonadaceae bacterium]